jgi:DNA recombination protein RmuC
MDPSLLPLVTFAGGLLLGLALMALIRGSMTNQFKVLSQETLGELMERTKESFNSDLAQKRESIDEMLRPVKGNLEALTGAVNQLKSTDDAVRRDLLNLQKETSKLAGAINNPAERGRFGEYILKTILDNSGLIEGQHYAAQASFSDGTATSRPDILIRIHDDLRVAIDAKAPIIDLIDDLDDDAKHEEAAKRLVAQVREHVKALAKRDYGRAEGNADFTVLFLPGDHLYAVVARHDRDLLDYAAKQKVLVASPMMLIGLLKIIVMTARQSDTARNAKRIAEVGADLHNRLKTFIEHLDKVGRALKSSVDTYNKSVGSMERMVLPKAREFDSLRGLPENEVLEGPGVLEAEPRIAELDEKAA